MMRRPSLASVRRLVTWMMAAVVLGLGIHLASGLMPRHTIGPRRSESLLPYRGRFTGDPRFTDLLLHIRRDLREAERKATAALGLSRRPARPRIRLVDDDSPFTRNGRFVGRTLQGSEGTPPVIELRLEPILSRRVDFTSLLIHEMTHAVMSAGMGPTYARLPVWLREGIAVRVAGESDSRLDRAISVTRLRPVTMLAARLRTTRHSTIDYGIDGYAVRQLEKLIGENGLPRLVRCLITEGTWPGCLESLTGLTPDQFEAQALSSVRSVILARCGDRTARFDRASSLQDHDWHAAALAAWEELIAEGPGPYDREAVYRSCRSLAALGRFDEAHRRLGALRAQGNLGASLSRDVLALQARVCRLAGRTREAVRVCTELARYYRPAEDSPESGCPAPDRPSVSRVDAAGAFSAF
ncbi:MAG: hypothetical protein ACE5HU_09895 [Acidobacteriota bacterium]